MLDLSRDSDINCRYSCGVLRAGFPRIFTSNNWIWPCWDKALWRRMQKINIHVDIRDMGGSSAADGGGVEEAEHPLHPGTVMDSGFSFLED